MVLVRAEELPRLSEMIRLVTIFNPAFNDLPPEVREYEDEQIKTVQEVLAYKATCIDISSVSLQRVDQWWPATWRQILPGCEIQAPDGTTWVCARGLSQVSPHEVEIYRFGQPEIRHTFTPLYDTPVQARITHEASMMALLMTELGARLIDDGS